MGDNVTFLSESMDLSSITVLSPPQESREQTANVTSFR